MAQLAADAAARAQCVVDGGLALAHADGGAAHAHAHLAAHALVAVDDDGLFVLDVLEQRAGAAAASISFTLFTITLASRPAFVTI